MKHDPLSDVLRSVHLRGAIYFYVSCRGEWAAATPPSDDLVAAGAVSRGAEHVLAYHLVARGESWAAVEGLSPVRLSDGDIVMFPRGDAHVLSSAPGVRPQADDRDWNFIVRSETRPISLALHQGVCEIGAEVPADEASAVIVCGFISCDLRPYNPLIGSLPKMLHLSNTGVGAWVAPVLSQAVAESRHQRAGSAAVLERVSEMVFVDAARRHLESIPEGSGSGWLAALRDRHVGRAIALLHEKATDPWTVEELGRQVGLSRSALHERFVELMGLPPMQYLANWRMQLGANLLRDGEDTVATIAQEIGYESEAAFARAFKRLVGQPPAAWRREQRAVH